MNPGSSSPTCLVNRKKLRRNGKLSPDCCFFVEAVIIVVVVFVIDIVAVVVISVVVAMVVTVVVEIDVPTVGLNESQLNLTDFS